jgi:HSP20 family molecular chaperone IbpA
MASKKTQKPEPEKQEQNREEASEGVVEGILSELGDVIPGLGRWMKGLGKSEAFRARVKAVEEEIEARLRETPRGNDECRMQNDERIRKSVHHSSFIVHHAGTVKREKEINVDVFDEGSHLRVIAEMPGVEEKDIKVEAKGEELSIGAETARRHYHRGVRLPCASREILKMAYRNGVLEIVLEKAKT